MTAPELDLDRIEGMERLYADRGDFSSVKASVVVRIIERLRAAEAEREEADRRAETWRKLHAETAAEASAQFEALEAASARVRELEQDRDDAHRQLDSLSEALGRVRELDEALADMTADRDEHRESMKESHGAYCRARAENAALRAVAALVAEWDDRVLAALPPVSREMLRRALAALPKVTT